MIVRLTILFFSTFMILEATYAQVNEGVESMIHEADAISEDREMKEALDEGLRMQDLAFASGEIVSVDKAQNIVKIRMYLDLQGNPKVQDVDIVIDRYTEITDGDRQLRLNELMAEAEVDVEYHKKTFIATYLFTY